MSDLTKLMDRVEHLEQLMKRFDLAFSLTSQSHEYHSKPHLPAVPTRGSALTLAGDWYPGALPWLGEIKCFKDGYGDWAISWGKHTTVFCGVHAEELAKETVLLYLELEEKHHE